ncbi:MAG: phosphatase PAP2 family protein [Xanthobacteraceae bacterium]
MTASPDGQVSAGSVHTLVDGGGRALARLAWAPSAPHRVIARRRLLLQLAGIVGVGAIVIVGLMLTVDVAVITAMPARGAAELWPARAITDFGKAGYVLWGVGLVLLVVVIAQPLLRERARLRVAGLEIRIAFVFLSLAIANLIGEGLKGAIGRGRPFVGGRADAFNFSPLSWHEPFESLPSAHAITAFALASAVAMAWPRTRVVMAVYAILIVSSRVALLAHHPSDVVAGALVGVIGTLLARQWLARRRLGFTIDENGRIAALPGPWA